MKKTYKTLFDIQMRTLHILCAHYGLEGIDAPTIERMLTLYKENFHPDGWKATAEGADTLVVYPVWSGNVDYETAYTFRFPTKWVWKDGIPTFVWWEK